MRFKREGRSTEGGRTLPSDAHGTHGRRAPDHGVRHARHGLRIGRGLPAGTESNATEAEIHKWALLCFHGHAFNAPTCNKILARDRAVHKIWQVVTISNTERAGVQRVTAPVHRANKRFGFCHEQRHAVIHQCPQSEMTLFSNPSSASNGRLNPPCYFQRWTSLRSPILTTRTTSALS